MLDDYQLRILNLGFIYAILGVSLNLTFGFTGQFSLGHAGFMAIGAYVTSLLTMPALQKEMTFMMESLIWPLNILELPFLPSLLSGGLAAALFAIIVGLPILRLKGDYLGIATLGFAEIIRVVANNLPQVTNGALGLKGIPAYANLWWTVGMTVLTVWVVHRLVKSSYGRAMLAIRENEIAAEAIGVNLTFHKVVSFAMGAFFAGIGGGLLASLITTIDPKTFSMALTFNILIVVIIGGLGSITGTVVTAVGYNILIEWLRPVEEGFHLGFVEIPPIPGLRMVVFAMLLMLVILYKQNGLFGGMEWNPQGVLARLRGKGQSTEGGKE
jgi:branched-chain amino acid transport system permease protein